MDEKQERFEKNVILETDLPRFYSNNGEEIYMSLDNINSYLTLDEVVSEYGRDIDFENRKFLQIIIKEKMKKLTRVQKNIAELRYLDNLTFRQIREKTGKSLSLIHYHLQKIDRVLSHPIN